MNTRILIITAAALFAVPGVYSQAPATAPKVKVTVKELKTTLIQTPQFQVTGSAEKRWRPKNWLEIDMALDVDKVRLPGDTSTLVDALEVKFYLLINQMDATKRYPMLTATMSVLNIPTKSSEHPHVLAYVTPSTLQRLFGENRQVNPTSDIKLAVEISYGGQVVGGFPIGQGKWWDDPTKYTTLEGAILAKTKTPFAPLWGDYDLEVK